MSFEYVKVTLWIDMKARRIFFSSSLDRPLLRKVHHNTGPNVNRFFGSPVAERLPQTDTPKTRASFHVGQRDRHRLLRPVRQDGEEGHRGGADRLALMCPPLTILVTRSSPGESVDVRPSLQGWLARLSLPVDERFTV